jgi:hypothetical protein
MAVEFLRSGRHRTAVIGPGNFPENSRRAAGVDQSGMADGDITVDLTVNEQHWDM